MFSERLIKISNFIEDDHDVADIGSDHGLLLVLLSNKKFKHNVLGVENKEGPFKNLENTVNKINKSNFKCIFSSGINDVTENYKTIVIAGMGFDTIKGIILENKRKLEYIEEFIIDCHTNQQLVRPLFYEFGYKIADETIVSEDGIYYDLIKFKKNYENITYNDIELKYGPINIKNQSKEFKDKYISILKKLEEIKHKLDNNNQKYSEIRNEIKEIKKVLR